MWGSVYALDLGLNTPVPLDLLESRVLVKHAGVPTTHLVVTDHLRVLDLLVSQVVGRRIHQVLVNPSRNLPMFFRDDLCNSS
jgi:hypothetical protein